MTTHNIIQHRLINQQIAATKFRRPEDIVKWFVAVQAQDFAMAKWAIGLRLHNLKEVDIEHAFNEGSILRTHLLRPTWHFVSPADIRWLLVLTAPRVLAVSSFMHRKLELDPKTLKRSNDVFVKVLEGGQQLKRDILQSALKKKRIAADGLRLGYFLMYAELTGIICSGARQGKQFTYALLDERVPPSKAIAREQAIASLAERYFASRGPATLRDFVWWSGLTVKDCREGIAMLRSSFVKEIIGGQEYIYRRSTSSPKKNIQSTFLLPDYDEYGISYKDRAAIFNSEKNIIEGHGGNFLFSHVIVVDGVIKGTWQRIVKNNSISVETASFASLNKRQQQAVAMAVKQYYSFIGKGAAKQK